MLSVYGEWGMFDVWEYMLSSVIEIVNTARTTCYQE